MTRCGEKWNRCWRVRENQKQFRIRYQPEITRTKLQGRDKRPAKRASMKRVSLLLLVGIVVLVGVLITPVHAAFQVVSQVVTFDQSLGQLPESIAIDKRGNIYVSFFLTGEIREITPDGAQSTLAILGAGPTTPYPGRRLSGL